MNISFLVQDSDINESNSVMFVSNRLIGALQISNYNTLIEKNKYGIYSFKKDNNTIHLEIYRIKEDDRYLINVININEKEKNSLIEVISNDSLFTNSIILMDSLSNNFISSQYCNLVLLENQIKQYFALALLERYGSRAYEIIENIKTKDDLNKLPSNIKTNLQRIELNTLIEYIIEKPLGGMEYEEYFQIYNRADLNPLKEILKENIFSDIKQELTDNKNIIKEYRNIICHNRFLNCDKMQETHCIKIDNIIIKLIEFNNKYLNLIYNTDNYHYYNETSINRFTFALKKKTDTKNDELILINILCKLNLVFDKSHLVVSEENDILYKYECSIDGIVIFMREIDSINSDDQLFIITIEYIEQNEEKNNMNDIILNELNIGDIIVLYDGLSINNSMKLSKSFTLLENLFREYITLFQYIEKVNNNNSKDDMTNSLRIGKSGKSMNSIYDLNFIDLLSIITAPNGGKNMIKLIQNLRQEIQNENITKIELLLNNMLDYNNDLKVIVKHWCELYRFRTIVAHCGILLLKDCKYISNIINSTRVTVENILSEYLCNNTEVFAFNKAISVENCIKVDNSLEKDRTCNISFINEYNDKKNILEVKNIYLFRVGQIIDTIMVNNTKDIQYVYSYEYLEDIIEENKEILLNLINSSDFKEKLNLVLEHLGFDDYADFRIITNQDQILEERIGVLLNSIHSKMKEV